MASIKVTIPERTIFFKENKAVQDEKSLAEKERQKAITFLKQYDEITEGLVKKFIDHLYSLIPKEKKYKTHRNFLSKKYKDRDGKRMMALLEIFVQKRTHPFDDCFFEGFTHRDNGEFSKSIYFGYVDNRRQKCITIHKMLSEINEFFKGNLEFHYYPDANNTCVEISCYIP